MGAARAAGKFKQSANRFRRNQGTGNEEKKELEMETSMLNESLIN